MGFLQDAENLRLLNEQRARDDAARRAVVRQRVTVRDLIELAELCLQRDVDPLPISEFDLVKRIPQVTSEGWACQWKYDGWFAFNRMGMMWRTAYVRTNTTKGTFFTSPVTTSVIEAGEPAFDEKPFWRQWDGGQVTLAAAARLGAAEILAGRATAGTIPMDRLLATQERDRYNAQR